MKKKKKPNEKTAYTTCSVEQHRADVGASRTTIASQGYPADNTESQSADRNQNEPTALAAEREIPTDRQNHTAIRAAPGEGQIAFHQRSQRGSIIRAERHVTSNGPVKVRDAEKLAIEPRPLKSPARPSVKSEKFRLRRASKPRQAKPSKQTIARNQCSREKFTWQEKIQQFLELP